MECICSSNQHRLNPYYVAGTVSSKKDEIHALKLAHSLVKET